MHLMLPACGCKTRPVLLKAFDESVWSYFKMLARRLGIFNYSKMNRTIIEALPSLPRGILVFLRHYDQIYFNKLLDISSNNAPKIHVLSILNEILSSKIDSQWETVSSAWHRRYPNPYSKHVLSEDVLSRSLENDVLKSKRLLVKTNPAPKWTTKFIGTGMKSACIIEESAVDPKKKIMTTYSRNIYFTSLMVVEEKCVYSVCPNNKNWTECRKDAWISSNVFGLARTIEAFGIERYKRNIDRARKGLEYITERLFVPDRLPYSMKKQNIGSAQ